MWIEKKDLVLASLIASLGGGFACGVKGPPLPPIPASAEQTHPDATAVPVKSPSPSPTLEKPSQLR